MKKVTLISIIVAAICILAAVTYATGVVPLRQKVLVTGNPDLKGNTYTYVILTDISDGVQVKASTMKPTAGVSWADAGIFFTKNAIFDTWAISLAGLQEGKAYLVQFYTSANTTADNADTLLSDMNCVIAFSGTTITEVRSY